MPLFRVVFHADRPDDLIDADDVRQSSTAVEFIADVPVMNRLRTVVVRRIASADVVKVVPVAPHLSEPAARS